MIATIFSGTDDLIVILVAVVVIFGGSQLPKLARNTGQALREFTKARADIEAESSSAIAAPAVDLPLPAADGSSPVRYSSPD